MKKEIIIQTNAIFRVVEQAMERIGDAESIVTVCRMGSIVISTLREDLGATGFPTGHGRGTSLARRRAVP